MDEPRGSLRPVSTRPGAQSGLSHRASRVAWSAMEAMLADEDAEGRLIPGSAEACDRGVAWLSAATGQASSDVRRGFGVLTFLLEWLPLFLIGAPHRMTRLPLAERLRYFEALEGSRIGLLTMLLMAFKVPMGIAAFEEGEELRSTGFDRPTTASRRSLVVTMESFDEAESDDDGDGASVRSVEAEAESAGAKA